MLLSAIITIGVLIFIHEGGHFLAARAFGVRVTEFMLGLPGPRIGFVKNGTKFGITCIPLGGYARVCGMTMGDIPPHTPEVLASVYARGEVVVEQIALDAGCTVDEAYFCLEELENWGSVIPPKKTDEHNTYRTPEVYANKKKGVEPAKEGTPRDFDSIQSLYDLEFNQQYRSKKFWQKSIILLAGIAVNLLFAILAFVVVYSVLGMDVTLQDGTVKHLTVDPLTAVSAGFKYIALTVQAIIGLFNPATTAATVSNSTSIVGIAVLSANYFAQGFSEALLFMAMISASLGLMNLIPIPPLDGGHFLVELIQKISGKKVPERVINAVAATGVFLLLCLFVVTLNQDIQRFIFGNWS
mgnify:FL=1